MHVIVQRVHSWHIRNATHKDNKFLTRGFPRTVVLQDVLVRDRVEGVGGPARPLPRPDLGRVRGRVRTQALGSVLRPAPRPRPPTSPPSASWRPDTGASSSTARPEGIGGIPGKDASCNAPGGDESLEKSCSIATMQTKQLT
jgi:hypothetical protein